MPMDLALGPDRLDWRQFQDLVRELCARSSDVRSARLHGTQGDAQGGIDVVVELISGETLAIQVRQRERFSVSSLEKTVAEATFPADRFAVALSREASAKVRDALKAHARWEVWDVKDLTARTRRLAPEEQRSLLTPFFGAKWANDFLGGRPVSPFEEPARFFEGLLDETKLYHHAWAIVGRDEELDAINDWLGASQPFFILTGRGAIGKTRILREAADRAQRQGFLVRFLSERVALTAENAPELPLGKALVIVDDAHRARDLSPLATLVQDRPDVKLLIATRPHVVKALEDTIARRGYEAEAVKIVELGELASEPRRALARQALGDANWSFDMELSRLTQDSPLMTTVAGQLVQQGQLSPVGAMNSLEFRRVVLRRFRDELVGRLDPSLDQKLVNNFLRVLSLVGRFRLSDRTDRILFSKFLTVEEHDLAKVVVDLERTGLLLRRGGSVRIVPDLLADEIAREAVIPDGQPTGYGDIVLQAFWTPHRASVLRNLAELDWNARKETGGSPGLLDNAWKAIEAEFETADAPGRLSLLNVVKVAAAFQPDEAMRISERAHSGVAAIPTDERTAYRDALADVLKNVALNLDRTARCVELLWQLAEGDERQASQFHSHPLRAISELAAWSPHKSERYQVAILDAFDRIASEAASGKRTPGPAFLLSEIFKKEGIDHSFEAGTVSYRGFVVLHEGSREIVQRAMKTLARAAPSWSPRARNEAIAGLFDALMPPRPLKGEPTETLLGSWSTVRREALRYLVTIATSDPSPVIRLEALSRIRDHARFSGKDEITTACRRAIDEFEVDVVLRFVHALTSPHESLRIAEGARRRERYDEGLRVKDCEAILEDLRKTRTNDAVLDLLVETLEQARSAGVNAGADLFVHVMAADSREAERLCRLSTRPEMAWISSHVLPQAIRRLRVDQPEVGRRMFAELVETGQEEIIHGCIEAYARLPPNAEAVSEDIALLEELSRSDDEKIAMHALRALVHLARDDGRRILEIARSFELGDSPRRAEKVLECMFHYPGRIDPATLDPEEIARLLRRLEPIENLRPWAVHHALGEIAKTHPALVLDFFLTRLEREDNYPYDPIPDSDIEGMFDALSPEDRASYLRKVRDLALARRRFDAESLFEELLRGHMAIGILVLREWMGEQVTEDRLRVVVSLLPEGNAELFFAEREFAEDLLDAIQRAEKEDPGVLRNRLLRIPFAGARTRAMWKADKDVVDLRDRALAEASAETRPLLRAFYHDLAARAQSSIDEERALDERTADEWE